MPDGPAFAWVVQRRLPSSRSVLTLINISLTNYVKAIRALRARGRFCLTISFNGVLLLTPLGNAMSLFTRKCKWSGAKVGNPTPVERMGKRFCSEDHANRYLEQVSAQGADDNSGGC